MSTFFKSRTIKISSILCKSIWKKSLKPKITLSGDWIKQAGFEIGESVIISVSKNQLIITKI
ncbi:type I toxin-antitoxin system SymE family toxin [Flavobacterium psychrophilum]|uniref:Toxin SymE-like domain-containing protein n=6 Tax=root TaxID=1 RepID=A6GXR8_FLAPJ|nr:SymE family type I addiction module toxin [Flavobacterium psychrophilum]YP_008320430.1 SymE family type I addiction module toxin [Flavobacterium phage 6H]YP_009321833.1 SymE family type I addiction module toxin [Flavobacterium phage 1H]YP_009322890.1 SymE family type I addiction module toxin [Flavobacterium phage 2A]YP_009592324.1 SymE family type I addiction module toxin [Flavobacterium phage 23T]QCW20066.1 SymE family type I addiction module toxin [Flavobacterium phage FPSV-D15]QCW20221.